MSAGDIFSILYRGEDPLLQTTKPKITQQPKIKRYWPGKAPDYASDEEEYVNEQQTDLQPDVDNSRLRRLTGVQQDTEKTAPNRDRTVIKYSTNEEESTSPHVEQKQIKIEEDEEEIQETREERRLRLKNEILKKRLEEEAKLAEQEEADIEGEEEYSEEEEESDEDDPSSLPLLKPVFVPKLKRDTIKEKEELEEEEKRRQQIVQQKLKEKKNETHKLALEIIKQEDENTNNFVNDLHEASENELPDDNDEENEAEEYEAWKQREMKRLKRDKEAREARSVFVADMDRRHKLTEEERFVENQQLDKQIPKKEKKYKQLFMQKYYHKGAFFQDKAQVDENSIYLRDFHAPVGEDLMNKKILPKAMRLRRGQFGRAGQVKHTHLVDVDTTDLNALRTKHDPLANKYKQKMAGLKAEKEFDRPKQKRK